MESWNNLFEGTNGGAVAALSVFEGQNIVIACLVNQLLTVIQVVNISLELSDFSLQNCDFALQSFYFFGGVFKFLLQI